MKEPDSTIFVPSEYAFLVKRGNEEAENWRELLDEAKQAVQDAYIANWQAYWARVATVAAERKRHNGGGRHLARRLSDARYVLSLSARAGGKGDLCQRS